jgi:WD40 repeat protein
VQWSRDGSKFVSMCGNFVSPLLCVFDGATFEPLTNFSIASWDGGWKEAHFSPAAGEATVGWIGFRSFGIFDAAANAPVCKGDVQEPLAKMLFSPSGDRMAVISQYTFSIIDTRTCELVRYMRLNLTALNLTHASFAHPFPIEWSSDGYFAAVLPRNNEPKTTYVLFLLDADSGALIRSIPLQSYAVAIAPAPLSVGAFVAVGTSTTQILQVDASATDSASVLSNNASWTLPDMRACGVMAWSPNGKFFAAAFRTTVRLFDVLTMRHIATLAELDIFHFIEALSWFPDSIHIATAASASGLRVWDLRRFADMSFFSNATAASNASAEGVEGMEATSNVGSDLKAGGAEGVVEEGFADGYARGGGVENESREESEGEGEDENGLNGGGVGEEDNEGGSQNAENKSQG